MSKTTAEIALESHVFAWVTPEWTCDRPFKILVSPEQEGSRAIEWLGCKQYWPSDERTMLVSVYVPMGEDASLIFPLCGTCQQCLDMDKNRGPRTEEMKEIAQLIADCKMSRKRLLGDESMPQEMRRELADNIWRWLVST